MDIINDITKVARESKKIIIQQQEEIEKLKIENEEYRTTFGSISKNIYKDKWRYTMEHAEIRIANLENEIKRLCPTLDMDMSPDDLRVVADKLDALQKMKKELKNETMNSYQKFNL